MAKRAVNLLGWLVLGCASLASAQAGTGFFDPFTIRGPGVEMGAIEPTLRKWYVPQELYKQFGWEQWRYSNYARETYQRYTNVDLEGTQYYNIYGDYITRGWRIYDWSQDQPSAFGSTVFKNPRFSSWFNNLVVASTSRGQYHTALTIGNEIRTTLTPLTFSKPTFNGVQWDFLTDKYALTLIASRPSNPGMALPNERTPPNPTTDFANLIGGHGTVQIGDMVKLGATYVNVFNGQSTDDWAENSLKGQLSSGQNATRIRSITIRLSDDSPEDGEGGALLFSEAIKIDGRRADIEPQIRGGVVTRGRREASGSEQIFLVYNLEGWSYVDEEGVVRDVNWFRQVTFELVLANDYKVDVTSNTQVDLNGQEIFLPVTRAAKNVKDATNQRVVRFDYGVPTSNEIFGGTLELTDVYGIWLRAEWDMNRRHRRFPNPNRAIEEHSLATKRAEAYYVQAQKLAYPWFLYGEVFSMEPGYSTRAYIPDEEGRVAYNRSDQYWYELVDDNDDQDRLPDWDRRPSNQTAGNEIDQSQTRLGGIFPGLDENNDFVSDFNQNDNLQPDYQEPFLRFNVEPPEFLFGVDMNNNTVIDRFENDTEADYPYKRDHRGYNAYVGAEVLNGLEASVGYMREDLISSNRRSKSVYSVMSLHRDFPDVGVVRVFEYFRKVKDDIPENLEQWEQQENTTGGLVPFDDPLAAQDTWINTLYADFTYTALDWVTVINKLKHERYRQLDIDERPGFRETSDFVGVVNKAYSTFQLAEFTVTPKVKSMYSYKTPVQRSGQKEQELWESLTCLVRYPFTQSNWVEAGVEYTAYFNMLSKDVIRASTALEDDYQGLVIAAEYTNAVDYMGYRLSSKIGFRQQTRYFEDATRTGNIVFIQVFAGLGE